LKKLLLFDIDGTLLRAENATRLALNETFRNLFSVKQTLDDLSFFAWTDLGLFREAALKLLGRPLNTTEYIAFIEIYTRRLREHLKTCVFYLMPGIAALLPLLAAREDILLGLETGNIEAAAYLKLKRGSIDTYFTFGGFGSDNEDRAKLILAGIERARSIEHKLIRKEYIYVIGDAPHDIAAGNKLGVKTIAVGTGLVDQEKVLAEKPSVYFKNLTDIQAFLNYIAS
jgi:phosphoglycolate phosphatase